MKPLSASDALRQKSPRAMIGSNSNRFSFLRDSSPGPSSNSFQHQRNRSVSGKRKMSNDMSYASATSQNLPREFLPLDSQVSDNLVRVNSLCDKIAGDIGGLSCDTSIILILGQINESIRLTNEIQRDFLLAVQSNQANTNRITTGTLSKKYRTESNASISRSQPVVKTTSTANSHFRSESVQSRNQESTEQSRFKDAVKEAEKSTLIFNLNMGNVPIMNVDTMSKKATLALTSMAAKVEGKVTSTPSPDSVAALDDVLSVTKGIKFFGNSTKTYRNTKDKESGAYCTIPVKYDFKDKDTRIKAEAVLRSRCKVSCATPYPTILRECIKQTIEHFKAGYPGDFFRVNVDAAKFSLKVHRKKAEEGAIWQSLDRDIGLPNEALNISSRTVPKDFKMPNLTNPILSPPRTERMEEEAVSPRTSRKDLPLRKSPKK